MGKGSPQPPNEDTLESLASLCTTIVIALFALTFLFQNFVIPSSSMASTLLVGDHVVVERASLAPSTSWAHFLRYRDIHRGEPIVFYKPCAEPNGEHIILVKRVIGVPGDRIHLRRGMVYLNGVAQNEPRAAKPNVANYDSYRDDFPSIPAANVPGVTAEWALELPTHIDGGDLVVPPDTFFVMGDNRTNSLDGRYWGLVPRANLIGRPLIIYWSFRTSEGQIYKTSLPDKTSFMLYQITHFFTETRWNRTLQTIN
jgi:signal peptidase I